MPCNDFFRNMEFYGFRVYGYVSHLMDEVTLDKVDVEIDYRHYVCIYNNM